MPALSENYQIEIEYKSSEHDLIKTFSALALFIEGDENFSNIFLRLLGEIETQKAIMTNIEFSSIKVFLRNVFRNTSDDQIREKGHRAFISQFLIEIKNYFLKILSEKSEIDHRIFDQVKPELIEIAKKNNIEQFIQLDNLSPTEFLDCIDYLIKPSKILANNQNIRIKCQGHEYIINKDINYNRSEIERSINVEEIYRDQEIRILVKKPDYIGQSKWDFYYDGVPINAKIMHSEWLKRFQNGSLSTHEIPLPGDGLRVRATIARTKDRIGRTISTEYEINEVLEVIKNHNKDEYQFELQ